MAYALFLAVTVLALADAWVVRLNLPFQEKSHKLYHRKIWHRYVFVTMLFVTVLLVEYGVSVQSLVVVVGFYLVAAAAVDALVVKERIRTGIRFFTMLFFRGFFGGFLLFSAWFLFRVMPFWLFFAGLLMIGTTLAVLFDRFHFALLEKRVRLVPYEHRNEDANIDHPVLRNVYMVRFPSMNIGVNAMLLGLYGKKHLLVSDAMLSRLRSEEILAIFVHELGHETRKHMRTRLWFALFGAIMLTAVGYAFLTVGFGSGATLAINAFMAFILAWALLRTLLFWLLHKQEYAADAYAKAMGYGKTLSRALQKIERMSHSTRLHPLYARFHLTHPRSVDRVLRLLE